MSIIARRPVISALVAPLLLAASCGTVNSVGLVAAPDPCPSGFCGPLLEQPTTFSVGGTGTCASFRIDFGDGSSTTVPITAVGANGTWSATATHTYFGWTGRKTVTATGVGGCGGSAKAIVRVLNPRTTPHEGVTIGVGAPQSATCTALPFHPLRKNTTVTIDSPSASNPPQPLMNFCALGCTYDADGIPNSTATSALPFPGKRQLSLVLRIGSSTEQGGTHETFITKDTGPLELCVNDDVLGDNTGAWRVFIQVDESAAP